MSAPDDYAEEARQYAELLSAACHPTRILELGSGGGNNASHLKRSFDMTLVELSSDMLAVSRKLNPECTHHQGDMRTLWLGEQFDAVFVHDAISYMTTPEDLARAIETAAAHCRPGGAVLLVPDYFRETYEPSVTTGGHDDGDRSLRYIEWTYDPDPADTTVERDFAFLLRDGRGPTQVVHDHHTTGLFARALWLDLCRKAGLVPEIRTVRLTHPAPVDHATILCRKED
jgi:SAM-dependent methyltransferase